MRTFHDIIKQFFSVIKSVGIYIKGLKDNNNLEPYISILSHFSFKKLLTIYDALHTLFKMSFIVIWTDPSEAEPTLYL